MNLAEQFAAKKGSWAFDPETVHHFSDGLYAKQMYMPKGFIVGTHAHNYSHLSILAKGRVILRTDADSQEYAAPACIEIKAGVHHQIESLEDCVWFCVHATDETDSDNIDDVLVQRDA